MTFNVESRLREDGNPSINPNVTTEGSLVFINFETAVVVVKYQFETSQRMSRSRSSWSGLPLRTCASAFEQTGTSR